MKILVHDYDEDLLHMLTLIFIFENIEVLPLQYIQKFKPDLVILDFKLDGTEAAYNCHLVREENRDLPVIALSSNSDIESDYLKHGFDGYITKPLDISLVVQMIAKYNNKNDLMQDS